MASWGRLTGICILLTIFFSFGIYLFTQGFLLRRLILTSNSTCASNFHYRTGESTASGCWLDRSYKRAVILIIDALRYDFVKEKISSKSDHFYHNKFEHLNRLLRLKPNNARLMKFIADPPTTTLQRLTGLTTGGLPTFIEFSDNFASSAVQEDNLINQFITNGKKITFMGDDTWLGLYPRHFHKSYPFPSFNVMDLHTVDNGVLQHLMPEFVQKDWDLLIAHFLGVDHCGHRYGPDHPVMAEKLKQMDGVIRNISHFMKEDTILFVMGDHGMTLTGDHGGDSTDELESALFVYSPSPITSNPLPKETRVVSQVDFVPTLSLLLGLPVPYSSLGCVITDLFSHSPKHKSTTNHVQNIYYSVEALHINAHQVLRYLEAYGKVSEDLSANDLKALKSRFHKIESHLQGFITKLHTEGENSRTLSDFRTFQTDLVELLSDAKKLCSNVWTRFNLFSMTCGLGVVSMTILLLFGIVRRSSATKVLFILASSITSIVGVLYILQDSVAVLLGAAIAAIVVLTFIMLAVVKKSEFTTRITKYELVFILCFGFEVLGQFSNSLVVHEDTVLTFLIVTMAFTTLTKCKLTTSKSTSKKRRAFDLIYYITSPNGMIVVMVLVLCACVRLSAIFHACREEQFCQSSTLLRPLSSFVTSEYSKRNVRYIVSTLLTLSVPALYRYVTQKDGNMNGHSPIIFCQDYAPKIISASTVLYWAFQALPSDVLSPIPGWQKRFLPMMAYTIVAIGLVISYIDGPSIYTVYRDTRGIHGDGNIVHRIFKHFKETYNTPNKDEKPPLVYGLATVYSSRLLFVCVCLIQLVTLLHSDGLAPAFPLMGLCAVLTLELASHHRDKTHVEGPPVSSIIMWTMLASKFFYATGHQASIPTLQWKAAFVGFEDDHRTMLVPGVLMVLNTFGARIIFTLALPLLIVWPYSRGHLNRYFSSRDGAVDVRGEYLLHENRQKFIQIAHRTFCVYVGLNAVKFLCNMLCAAILRRHLMVWKIFAPKFIFEGLDFLVTCVCTVISSLYLGRLDNLLEKWTTKMTKEQSQKLS